jgi:lambda repressor-like predicted transcriptional regulator
MAPPPNLLTAVRPILERLHREPPVKRIKMAFHLMEQLTAIMADIAGARRSGVRELRKEGWTLAAVAAEAGISVSRVKQIEDPPANNTLAKKRQRAIDAQPREPKVTVNPDDVIRQAYDQ